MHSDATPVTYHLSLRTLATWTRDACVKKLIRALRRLRLYQEKIELPDECVSLNFVSLRQPTFTLQHKHRLSATFVVDFWSTPERLSECELQAKKYLVESLFSDVRVLIEKLRLNITTRDGQALLTLQELEHYLFEVEQGQECSHF